MRAVIRLQDRESVIESDAISNLFSTNTRHRGSNSEKHLGRISPTHTFSHQTKISGINAIFGVFLEPHQPTFGDGTQPFTLFGGK